MSSSRRAVVSLGLLALVAGCGDADPGGSAADRPGTSLSESSGTAVTVDGSTLDAELAEAESDIDAAEAVDCEGGLVVDGVVYRADWDNRGRIAADRLGEMIGAVAGEWNCAVSPADLGAGIFGTGVAPGAEVRAVPGRPASTTLAIAAPDGVQVFRTDEAMSLTGAIADDVVEIGINSEYDGTTRFATIDDPATIASLLEDARGAAPDAALSDLGDGPRYFIEFVHPDGLSTTTPFVVATSQLWDRIVGPIWVDSVTAALAAAPGAPTVDDVSVSAADGPVAVHPLGSCRIDRPDVTASPGDTIHLDTEEGSDVRWWINPPNGTGELLPGSSQQGSTLLVPDFDGAAIVEIYRYLDGGVVQDEHCVTLATTGATGSTDPEPSGLLECSATNAEPTVEEYGDDLPVPNRPTIAEAVAAWIEHAAQVRPDIAEMTAITTPFAPAADLIDADGRVQVVLELAGDDPGWIVTQAVVCPAR